MDRIGHEAGGVGGHHEAANTIVGLSPNHGNISNIPIGDPHFRPVEDPIVTIALGVSAHTRGVGPKVCLGESKATNGRAGGHLRQPHGLLLLGAKGVDRVHCQGALHTN